MCLTFFHPTGVTLLTGLISRTDPPSNLRHCLLGTPLGLEEAPGETKGKMLNIERDWNTLSRPFSSVIP